MIKTSAKTERGRFRIFQTLKNAEVRAGKMAWDSCCTLMKLRPQ